MLGKRSAQRHALTQDTHGTEVQLMLSEYPIHAALPATDLERAKRFYTDKLGLTPESDGPDGLFYVVVEGAGFLSFPLGELPAGPIPR
jgi:predicted enzyme related to lactoylglutathione lyase